MRRSPLYAYPSDPRRNPHANFYASPLFPQHQQYRPSPPPSHSSPPPARSVINIPVFDSPTPVSPSPPPKQPPAPRIDLISAATLIQSCFRGYSIRRHRPLLHLRTISASRKQLEDFKLELESPGFSHKVRSNEKERLRFSESIMAVILRLDAIEGSIPEVRSQRKEATKMAIKLQDAMDAIMLQQEEILDSKSPGRALPDVDHQTEGFVCSEVNVPQEAAPSVQEERPGLEYVTIVKEATTLSQAEVPDTLDANMMPEETKEMDTVNQELEDWYGVQDKPVEENEGVQDEPVEAVDDQGQQMSYVQGGNAAQVESEWAIDNVVHDTSCRQASLDDYTTEDIGIQAEGRDGACTLEGSSIVLCTNDANQNDNNEEITNVVSANDIDADNSYEHTNGREEDAKCSSLRPGTPCAEDRLNAARSVAGDSSPMVENDPSLTEQFHKKAPTEISAMCGDGLQDLHEVIPKVDALSTETNTLCADGLQIHTVPGDGVSSSLDSALLKQLSKECGQLKSLLGKLLVQSQAQNRVICALGDRLEMLEHQQGHGCQNNPQRGKRKPKKGSKRIVRMSQQ